MFTEKNIKYIGMFFQKSCSSSFLTSLLMWLRGRLYVDRWFLEDYHNEDERIVEIKKPVNCLDTVDAIVKL